MATSTARNRSDSGVIRIAPARTAKRAPRQHKVTGVVTQIRTAFKPRNALATVCGMILGGFIPVASFCVAHFEAGIASAHGVSMLLMVFGGLLFSAKTVWQWARLGFADPVKATGFVVLLEGVMTLSGIPGLSYAALALLTAINGIATGVTLSRR